jgi:hypothetical protein
MPRGLTFLLTSPYNIVSRYYKGISKTFRTKGEGVIKEPLAGFGRLLVSERETPVAYDLVWVKHRNRTELEGTLFGNHDDLREAFLRAEHWLRLADGNFLQVVILNIGSGGAAEVRAMHPYPVARAELQPTLTLPPGKNS